MWDLFTQEGITTAIRPTKVQDRVGLSWVEVSGISWGRHREGEWIAGEQHKSAPMDWFTSHVARPAIKRGADLCDLVIKVESSYR